jgi:hypothetical protein
VQFNGKYKAESKEESYVVYENGSLSIFIGCEANKQIRNKMFMTVLKMIGTYNLPKNIPIV